MAGSPVPTASVKLTSADLNEAGGKPVESIFLILFVCCADQMVTANPPVNAVPGKEEVFQSCH